MVAKFARYLERPLELPYLSPEEQQNYTPITSADQEEGDRPSVKLILTFDCDTRMSEALRLTHLVQDMLVKLKEQEKLESIEVQVGDFLYDIGDWV